MPGLLLVTVSCLTGCQDGPLYALKTVNPYFVAKEWREDRQYGITDHERRQELTELAETIDRLPDERQQFWLAQLTQLMEHDPSAEMRRIAVLAAGNAPHPSAVSIIDRGLDDDSFKVRMEACRALGKRSDEQSTRTLAAVVGTETNRDVRHAAFAALGNHDNDIAQGALRLALAEKNPATQVLAMTSLKQSTGKDYGNNPEVWIAALDGKPVEESSPSFSDRLRDWF